MDNMRRGFGIPPAEAPHRMGDVEAHTRTYSLTVRSHRGKRSHEKFDTKLTVEARIPQTIHWNCVNTKRRDLVLPYSIVAELSQEEVKLRRREPQRAV